MGKIDKTLKSTNPSIVQIISSDDDEEANEDLSLKIVEKSLLQACNSAAADISVSPLPARESADDVAPKSRRKAKKVKIKVKKKLEEIVKVVDARHEENTDTSQAVENSEVNPVEKSDSLVLRKLLRGPRYFDPPDSGSGWGECYNCGEEGHTAANCTSTKRKKPCFICGSSEHQAKQCTKGKDCYICKKGGHRAKDCPENDKRVSKILKICLKCGGSGHHDMFSCNNEYSPEDLKVIQCYICKSFGHLCCVDFTDTSSIELSCYRCGQLGHGGLDCGKSRIEKNSMGTPGKCYKCQEVGHIAKKCPSLTKNFSQQHSEKANGRSSGKCRGCGKEGHIARDCPSSTKDGGESLCKTCFTCGKEGHIAKECLRLNEGEKRKFELSTPAHKFSKEKVKFEKAKSATQKRKKAEFEEEQTPTPYSLKKRGGWITEDPIQWDSPVTPTYNRSMVHSSGVSNGRDFSFDDTRYEPSMIYRRGLLDQPRDRYGLGPSSEPYRQYRHAPPINESYHQSGYAPPSNGPYRPHHRYVVSPPDLPYVAYADTSSIVPPPSRRPVDTRYPHVPSPSHQPYLSSGSFQPTYQSRFHSSSSDGMQRIRHHNR